MTPIILDNKKLHDLIFSKDLLVTEGRKISKEIEAVEIKIRRFEEKEKQITGKVVPPIELTTKGDELIKQLQKLDKELTDIANKINDFKLSSVPKEMKENHLKLMKDKEGLERERNKIALKVQKIKDKCIPIIQKEVKPMLLDKYDDIETAKTKDGKVVIATFNHLEDFKKKFGK
jgi:predicted  nucleic acid-binding Zn-ribbon protein